MSSGLPQLSVDPGKIQHYEYFLNDVLRTDLRISLERRDALYTQIAEYLELQRMLDKVISPENQTRPSIRTKVDIGCNFYVQAEVEDLSSIAVDVGCGIWVTMSPLEAKKFCEKKIAFLNKRVDALTNEELSIKAKINVVMSALKELQSL